MASGAEELQWRGMDKATLERAYSPSSALNGPIDPYIAAYVDQSAAAYAACPNVKTIRYGERDSNTIDVVTPPSDTPTPLHIFIHGGYWQELSKRESFFPAPDTLARGMAFAAVDYTLCPQASLDEIVEECSRALDQLISDAERLNIDPARIVLSGSSAGAHLAAMVCLKRDAANQPAGVVLLSGVYELEPLLNTYINDAVGMDRDTALRNSPGLLDVGTFPPAVIAWGAQETDEFKRQSRRFAQRLHAAGRSVETLEMAGRNHFDIVHDIANDSALGRKLSALIEV